jgi:hypothetical protein
MTQMSASVAPDTTRSLIVTNLVTLALALIFKWPLGLLLWPYWIQSVVIGYFGRKRMLALQRFSTQGVTINDRPAEANEATQKSTANFFAVHYGFFHLGYLVFIAARAIDLDPWDWLAVALAGISFAWNHRYSYQQNIEADATGTPNIGTLMFLPYMRIVPMHLTILAGGVFTEDFSAPAIIVFSLLKTAADVGMHLVEHRLLQKQAKATL